MVWLAVMEDSVSLLELTGMTSVARYSYSRVLTFGGCQDDFMLVVATDNGSSHKLLFSLSKLKVRVLIYQLQLCTASSTASMGI